MAAQKRANAMPDKRREQMLQAAVDVICERGFSETRISDVAKITGSSPALVIYYFGTKDGLLTEALRYSDDLFYAATHEGLSEYETAREKLDYLVRVTCVKQCDGEAPGAWGLWFDLWAQAFRHPAVARDRAEFDRGGRARSPLSSATVRPAGSSGPLDVEEFCIAFAALLDGLSIQVALDDDVVTADRAVAVAMRFAGSYLGFGSEPAPAGRGARRPARQVTA